MVNMVEMTCPLPLPRHPGEGRDDNMGSTLPVVSVGQRTFLRGFVTLAQAVLPRRQRLRLAVDPHGGGPAAAFERIIVPDHDVAGAARAIGRASCRESVCKYV